MAASQITTAHLTAQGPFPGLKCNDRLTQKGFEKKAPRRIKKTSTREKLAANAAQSPAEQSAIRNASMLIRRILDQLVLTNMLEYQIPEKKLKALNRIFSDSKSSNINNLFIATVEHIQAGQIPYPIDRINPIFLTSRQKRLSAVEITLQSSTT